MTDRVLMLVTDPAYGIARTLATVGAVSLADRFVVQHRDKRGSALAVADDARRLRDATRAVGARLVLNAGNTVDDVLALAHHVGADGVHLPAACGITVRDVREALGAGAFASAAVHDDDAARRMVDAGASAILVSPIFTSDKLPARGVEALQRASAIARGTSTRVLALGGVDARRVASCFAAGADGVAVIRALYDASDIPTVARQLVDFAG